MKYRCLRAFLLVGLGLLLVSCSITRVKWRIKWDKGLEDSKAAYMEAPLPAEKDRQPNIILLVADDLGPYEVSAYGVEHISTPNIDQIGKDGVVFEEGYATAPTCAPARAGLMTGRVQNRYGFETQVMEFYPSNDGVLPKQLRRIHLGQMVGRHGRIQSEGQALIPLGLAGAQARRAPVRDHALGDPEEVRLQHGAHRQMAPRHPPRTGALGPGL
ncbi:MAG: sulfatase-like hydrolase/transferase [Deltaproteobacteria bacterium]|nr:sulfatase-like hydrolase/transferase [Deltaproteobacteria bacterium]